MRGGPALAPRRAMRTLGDSFGFEVRLGSAAGALPGGYGLFLLARALDLLGPLHL
ncbi:hypothetical protein GXW82_17595 [Streptacidiphilus sp. 4-A2]|nr:hypothetical protein [Streptacidiphilus sp. 4-A2]